MANHAAYGFTNFFPTIVKGLNFGDTTITLVLTAPPYILATIVAFSVARSSDYRHERGWHIILPLCFSVIGFIISVATLNKAARYVAAFLYAGGCYSSNALIFGWASNTLNQSPEKRACAFAIINIVSQLGSIASPYFFPAHDGPRYVMAFLLMLGSTLLAMSMAGITKVLLIRTNKMLKASGRTGDLFML